MLTYMLNEFNKSKHKVLSIESSLDQDFGAGVEVWKRKLHRWLDNIHMRVIHWLRCLALVPGSFSDEAMWEFNEPILAPKQ